MTGTVYQELRLRALAKIALKEAELEGLTEASVEELVGMPPNAPQKSTDGEV